MEEVRQWFHKTRIEETLKNLIHHGFNAIEAPDRSAACLEVLKRIPNHKTVGVGGSVTLREIGVIPKIEQQGNLLYDHWKPGLSQEESLQTRRAQQTCDVFLTSANAITISGEIVNVDGACNRISVMGFGPKQVIIIAGRNKIVKDVPDAIARIRNVAGPMNAKRLGVKTPCVELGRCADCNSPERICRGMLILDRQPLAAEILVILVDEELGY